MKSIISIQVVALLAMFSAFNLPVGKADASAKAPSQQSNTDEVTRIILILDASGSMWGQVDGKTKISIAKEVTTKLIEKMPADFEVGLSAYGHNRKGDCRDIELLAPVGPLNLADIKSKIDAINPKGMTPLSDAVQQAAKALRSTEQRATVVLVSDGIETCNLDPCKVATELAMGGLDFTVHVIGFDLSKAEQARLRCMADKTGGLFLAAADAPSLHKALTQTIDKAQEPPAPIKEDPGTAQLIGPETVQAGAHFKIQWQGPDSRRDYIGVGRKGATDPQLIDYAYTEKGNPIQLTAPGDPGEYELYYIHAHTGKVIGRAPIQVIPVQASVKAPTDVPVGAKFKVTWQGPAYDADYITVAKPEDVANGYDNFVYASDGNPIELQAPDDPGVYEVRYIMDKGLKILAKAEIIIKEVNAQVNAPQTVIAGASFEVPWQGPNYKSDYITLARPDHRFDQFESYVYTSKENPIRLEAPVKPGNYEVRYIMHRRDKILAKAAITVNKPGTQVNPPQTVIAGASFEVPWQGPNYSGDFITLARPDHGLNQYESFVYTSKSNPVTFQAPIQPGNYEVRYIMDKGDTILAKAAITVNQPNTQINAPQTVDTGASFDVPWKGPNYNSDYITLARPDHRFDQFESYVYTSKGNPIRFEAPVQPGDYEVRYIMAKAEKILAKAAITVKQPDTEVNAPKTVDAGASFEVPWKGPNFSGDYITLARPDHRFDQHESYVYTEKSNPVQLEAPIQPGNYEVRYIMRKGDKILAKATITVNQPHAQINAPQTVKAGASFEVPWQGPNYSGDYITLARPDHRFDQYESYVYTDSGNPVTFQAPDQSGNYEVRYIMSKGQKILGQTAIQVK